MDGSLLTAPILRAPAVLINLSTFGGTSTRYRILHSPIWVAFGLVFGMLGYVVATQPLYCQRFGLVWGGIGSSAVRCGVNTCRLPPFIDSRWHPPTLSCFLSSKCPSFKCRPTSSFSHFLRRIIFMCLAIGQISCLSHLFIIIKVESKLPFFVEFP